MNIVELSKPAEMAITAIEENNHLVTANLLAAHMKKTVASVRYLVALLINEGLIEVITVDPDTRERIFARTGNLWKAKEKKTYTKRPSLSFQERFPDERRYEHLDFYIYPSKAFPALRD